METVYTSDVMPVLTQLGDLAARLEDRLPASVTEPFLEEFCDPIPDWREPKAFDRTKVRVDAAVDSIIRNHGLAESLIFKRLLIARLAITLPDRLSNILLSPGFISRYGNTLKWLYAYIENDSQEPYKDGDEFFLRDLRLVMECAVPNGATSLDLRARVTTGSLVKGVFRMPSMSLSLKLLATGGTAPWFRLHVEMRNLTEFKREIFDKCHADVAELLLLHRSVRGMVGTSWLFDPQLLEVSPKVGYIQRMWTDGGAIPLRHGASEANTRFALERSRTRRALYDEGKYLPINYSLLWPRKALIAWAKEYRRSNPV